MREAPGRDRTTLAGLRATPHPVLHRVPEVLGDERQPGDLADDVLMRRASHTATALLARAPHPLELVPHPPPRVPVDATASPEARERTTLQSTVRLGLDHLQELVVAHAEAGEERPRMRSIAGSLGHHGDDRKPESGDILEDDATHVPYEGACWRSAPPPPQRPDRALPTVTGPLTTLR